MNSNPYSESTLPLRTFWTILLPLVAAIILYDKFVIQNVAVGILTSLGIVLTGICRTKWLRFGLMLVLLYCLYGGFAVIKLMPDRTNLTIVLGGVGVVIRCIIPILFFLHPKVGRLYK